MAGAGKVSKSLEGSGQEYDNEKAGAGKEQGMSDTLCPTVHILGTKNVHSRAKGTADHYWPWAVFLKILKFRQGSGPEGGLGAWRPGGLEAWRPGTRGLEPQEGLFWPRGLGALRGPRGWGLVGGLDPQGTGWTFARSLGRMDRETDGRTDGNSPLCSKGHRPLRVRCPKGETRRREMTTRYDPKFTIAVIFE